MGEHRGKWEYTLSSRADSVPEARALVRDALAPFADPETLGDIELVVSELVTNSVVHGPGIPITLRLVTTDNGDIAGEVVDRGRGLVAIREHDPEKTVGGLGLPLVESLASEWGVYAETTHVWFRFAAAA